ncbi:hypothetical protein N7537_001929 [Penicillium hordei]|uniref:Uncharacterized protein n=1 Tax=Penicillium hordei TaxID=40994 RepID=A0AAD6H8F9_9EURO|nr:uncharacterized protein N7537_001929 [Penicillium hordei]KAJ5616815.1 hypothetical protein N7537_001929 [Penicillium hordei]
MAGVPPSRSSGPDKPLDSEALWQLATQHWARPDSARPADSAHLATIRQELKGDHLGRAFFGLGRQLRGLGPSENHPLSSGRSGYHHAGLVPVTTFQCPQEWYEDPIDFIKDIETAVERDYARETTALNTAMVQTKTYIIEPS